MSALLWVLGPSPSPSPRLLQVLHDCQRYRSNVREIGELWVGPLTDGTTPKVQPWSCWTFESCSPRGSAMAVSCDGCLCPSASQSRSESDAFWDDSGGR